MNALTRATLGQCVTATYCVLQLAVGCAAESNARHVRAPSADSGETSAPIPNGEPASHDPSSVAATGEPRSAETDPCTGTRGVAVLGPLCFVAQASEAGPTDGNRAPVLKLAPFSSVYSAEFARAYLRSVAGRELHKCYEERLEALRGQPFSVSGCLAFNDEAVAQDVSIASADAAALNACVLSALRGKRFPLEFRGVSLHFSFEFATSTKELRAQ